MCLIQRADFAVARLTLNSGIESCFGLLRRPMLVPKYGRCAEVQANKRKLFAVT